MTTTANPAALPRAKAWYSAAYERPCPGLTCDRTIRKGDLVALIVTPGAEPDPDSRHVCERCTASRKPPRVRTT